MIVTLERVLFSHVVVAAALARKKIGQQFARIDKIKRTLITSKAFVAACSQAIAALRPGDMFQQSIWGDFQIDGQIRASSSIGEQHCRS